MKAAYLGDVQLLESGSGLSLSTRLTAAGIERRIEFRIRGDEADLGLIEPSVEPARLMLIWPLMEQGVSRLEVDHAVDAAMVERINSSVVPLLRTFHPSLGAVEVFASQVAPGFRS